jgi:glycosyltransferase involved in cell wall biosynthesis
MKVLYFSDNTSDHNLRFLKKLSQTSMEVWFLDPTSPGLPEGWLPGEVREIRSQQILRRGAGPADFKAFLAEFLKVLTTINPDVIHAGPTHTSGFLTALSGFHPWLLASWGSDVLYQVDQGSDWKHATQAALTAADGFFCDCDAVRNRARDLADLNDTPIVQLPWGVERKVFGPDGEHLTEKEFAREPETCVLISTRSWEPLYAVNILLEAFLQAYRIDSSLRLLLLGNGSQAAQILEFIREYKLERVVRTPGAIGRQEIPKWFRAADFYVSCSRTDGTSVSLLEAMATGLPAVVSDIAPNREWIVEGHNGWLAAVDSVSEFADKMVRAARLGAAEREAFSGRNREIIEERADWDLNFPKLLTMYEDLTSNFRKP